MGLIGNSTLSFYIDEFISSERDRAMLKRKLVDNITFESLGAEFNYSTRQTKRIIKSAKKKLEEAIRECH